MRKVNKMECLKCDYNWESRVENPKECPRCKVRLDYKEVMKNEK